MNKIIYYKYICYSYCCYSKIVNKNMFTTISQNLDFSFQAFLLKILLSKYETVLIKIIPCFVSLFVFFINCEKWPFLWLIFIVTASDIKRRKLHTGYTAVFHFRFSKTGFDSRSPISFSGLWIRHRVSSLFFKQLESGVNVKGDSYTVSSINYKKSYY